MGITDSSQFLANPHSGALFETLVVGEYFKRIENLGDRSRISYYRDTKRNEIDLVVEKGSDTQLCEIKSAAVFNPGWTSVIDRLSPQFGKNVSKKIIYGGDESYQRTGLSIVSWREI